MMEDVGMNRDRFRRLAVAASLALSTALLIPALAQHPHPGHAGPRVSHDGMRHMLHRLDLTEDQQDEMRQLVDRHRQQTRPQVQQVSERRLDLFDRVHAPELDEAAIRDAAIAVAAAAAEIAVARAVLLQQVRQLLTPEQLEDAQELLVHQRAVLQEGGGARFGGRREGM
jgi:Spy/CpxP family protein refolding chaperone